jgi:hypothetical protein
MQKMTFVRVLILACTLLAEMAFGDTVSSKGMSSVLFSGSAPTATQHEEALKQAKINAIERYFSETNSAQLKNYELVRSKIADHIDDYVIAFAVLSDESDKATKQLRIVIRADLNTIRLSNTLQASSAISNTAESQRSLLTFIFVAREQQSVQTFSEKNYKRTDTHAANQESSDTSHQGSEGEKLSKHEIQTHEQEQRTTAGVTDSSESTTSGGSVTRKGDAVEWRVTPAAEINSMMTGIFSNAGYEVVEAEYLEQESNQLLSIAAFRADYSKGDDLSPVTLRNAVKGAQAASVPYLALGTLDVGVHDTDPTTGLTRVYVTVIGKVLNVTGRFPKTVSSVGPVQFAGLGPNESVARINALKLAAENAANQLMNELNAKGVQ